MFVVETGSDMASVTQFAKKVRQIGKMSVTVRIRRGIDIDAGCGQLADRLSPGTVNTN